MTRLTVTNGELKLMAKATTTGQAVAPVTNKAALALADDLDLSFIQGDAGEGVEDMGVADVALPYIAILQSNSPQVQPGLPKFIEGAQASMFMNTVSNEAFDGRNTGFLFIPCYYERKYVEWVDRDKGGGWVGDYEIDSDIMKHTVKNEKGRPVLKGNGNLIVETAYHYGYYQDPDEEAWMQCVIAMKSTNLKINRAWNNELITTKIPGSNLTAPRWLYPYRIKTTLQQKNANSWWQYLITRETKTVNKEMYEKAKAFRELVASGLIKRGAEADTGDTAGVNDTGGETPDTIDGDIPF